MEPDQEEIEVAFKVTNSGEDEVEISRVKSSCGCTGSVVDRNKLSPGESTEITAKFIKGSRQGLNRNKLDIFIKGRTESAGTLHMNVKIPKLIEMKPAIIYWAPSGSKDERRIAVILDQRYVDRISDIEFDGEKLDVVQEVDPEEKATVILSITPKSYDVFYRGTVTIHAAGKDGHEAKASILALVQP